MKRLMVTLMFVPLALAGCSGGSSDSADPGVYCSYGHFNGADYYVQFVPSPGKTGEGLCGSAPKKFTADEFRKLDLTRQCVLSDDRSILQKGGMVSYYSDSSPKSVEAAKSFCS